MPPAPPAPATPRPIAELAAHAKNLRGVFTDIDDTLTHNGALVPAAYTKLCELKAAGLRVVPVTGRPAGYAAVLAAMWPVDAVVAENGAVAFVRGRREPIYWDAADASAAANAEADADARARAARRGQLLKLRDEILQACPWARLAEDNWLRLCDVAFDIGERCQLSIEQRTELCARIAAAGAQSVVSTVHAHAYFGDWDKAQMLCRVAKELWGEDLGSSGLSSRGLNSNALSSNALGSNALGSNALNSNALGSNALGSKPKGELDGPSSKPKSELVGPSSGLRSDDRDRYLFVGDSPNDAAGFEWFPLSAGVANVKRYAGVMKTLPRFVAEAEGGFGFAEIAELVIAARATMI